MNDHLQHFGTGLNDEILSGKSKAILESRAEKNDPSRTMAVQSLGDFACRDQMAEILVSHKDSHSRWCVAKNLSKLTKGASYAETLVNDAEHDVRKHAWIQAMNMKECQNLVLEAAKNPNIYIREEVVEYIFKISDDEFFDTVYAIFSKDKSKRIKGIAMNQACTRSHQKLGMSVSAKSLPVQPKGSSGYHHRRGGSHKPGQMKGKELYSAMRAGGFW